MKQSSMFLAGSLCVVAALLPARPLAGGERTSPARIEPSPSGMTDAERRDFVAWALARREVRQAAAGHRTRVLRVWSDVVKGETGLSRRKLVLVRDYDAGVARE